MESLPSTFDTAEDFSLVESGKTCMISDSQPMFDGVDQNWIKAPKDANSSTTGSTQERFKQIAQSSAVDQFAVIDEKTESYSFNHAFKMQTLRPNLSISKSVSCPDFSQLSESPKRKRISSKVDDPKQIKQRRDYHNRTERIRMAKIRNAIEELKKEMEDQGLKVHRERAQILTRAIAHFRFLQQQIREVQLMNQTLMSRVQQYTNNNTLAQQPLDLGVLGAQPMMPEQPRMDDKSECMPHSESNMLGANAAAMSPSSLGRTLDASGRRWGKRRYRSYNRE